MYTKLSISNVLIILSIIATILSMIFPFLYNLGINNIYLSQGLYHIYFLQFFIGTFIHVGIIHLFFNALFLNYFGNVLELLIGKKSFFIFFIFSTIFNGIMITNFSSGNNIGISGFCMALLTYYTLELRSRNNPEYKGGITAILLNIFLGIMPGISFYGHFFGALSGVIYYLFTKDFFRRKYVGLDVEA